MPQLRYDGLIPRDEHTYTGQRRIWQPGQIDEIPAALASNLLRSGYWRPAEALLAAGAPLPVFARPMNLATLGDSLAARGNSSTVTTLISVAGNVDALSQGQFAYSWARAFATAGTQVSGGGAPDHLTQIGSILAASGIDVVLWLSPGTNSLAALIDGPTLLSQIRTGLSTLTAAGKLVLLCTIPPRATGAENAVFYRDWTLVNDYIVRQSWREFPQVVPVDLGPALCRPGTPMAPLPEFYQSDLLHFSPAGAMAVAAEVLAAARAALRFPPEAESRYWSDALNGYTDYFANGAMTGTGGTNSAAAGGGTTSTGTIASNWTAQVRAAGPIITHTAGVTDPAYPGVLFQKVALSGTGANNSTTSPGYWAYSDFTPSGGNIAAGDVVFASMRVLLRQCDGMMAPQFRLALNVSGTVTAQTYALSYDSDSLSMPNGPQTADFYTSTPVYTVGAGMTGLRLFFSPFFRTGAPLAGSLLFGDVRLWKVA